MWRQAICIFVMWQQEAFPEVEKSIKFLFLHHDNNDSVATKVANVSKRTIWKDTTTLFGGAPNFSYSVSKSCLHSLINQTRL
jgi:predicted AAA+ superfamily ATPase